MKIEKKFTLSNPLFTLLERSNPGGHAGKLNKAVYTLTDEETAIIHALFYQEVSETELAKRLGIARTTLQ